MSLLNVQGLHKTFGTRPVVTDVSFTVGEGEIIGLLGRNGAGKTTSFRMTMGMIRPNKGSVLFHDRDVSQLPMYRRAQLGMGYLAQEPSIFQRLTVEQNLLAILETRPHGRAERRERCEELMTQFGLTKLRRQPARTLSGGERRKLEIARALISEPTLILLDEPFSGVDPKAVEDLQEEVRRLRSQRDISILITDHNVQRTLEIVDRAYVLAEGKLLAEGTPRELINNPDVRENYLGSMFKGDEFDNTADLATTPLNRPQA
ncbi:MAG: LPS export ABC transporter ATP-binding protein [Phycisphaeraceae bacterium]